MAFDLEPTESAIEALPDRRRRLRGSTIALHADRSCFGLGAVRLANSLSGALAGTLNADFGACYPTAENDLTRLGAHGCDYSAFCGRPAMPLGFDVRKTDTSSACSICHARKSIGADANSRAIDEAGSPPA
jgi:hypothetical protein